LRLDLSSDIVPTIVAAAIPRAANVKMSWSKHSSNFWFSVILIFCRYEHQLPKPRELQPQERFLILRTGEIISSQSLKPSFSDEPHNSMTDCIFSFRLLNANHNSGPSRAKESIYTYSVSDSKLTLHLSADAALT
jgi:hypothetical protein